MVILIVANIRLILENLFKYGLRVRAGFWVSALGLLDAPRTVPLAATFVLLNGFVLASLAIERVASRLGPEYDAMIACAHVVNSSLELGVPIAVIHFTKRWVQGPLGS